MTLRGRQSQAPGFRCVAWLGRPLSLTEVAKVADNTRNPNAKITGDLLSTVK
jgi:hypothetical protein